MNIKDDIFELVFILTNNDLYLKIKRKYGENNERVDENPLKLKNYVKYDYFQKCCYHYWLLLDDEVDIYKKDISLARHAHVRERMSEYDLLSSLMKKLIDIKGG